MTVELSRRDFFGGALAAGVLSLAVTGCGSKNGARIQHADQTGELVANMWVTVMPDGRIALAVNKAEIGQGVTTGYATMVAEELSVPLAQVDTHFADSHPEYRTTFNLHATGGSTSTKEGFKALRRASASAREMLVSAAAAAWHVPTRECAVANGKVLHAASQREATYGDLTKLAARESVPDAPRLKKPSEFTLIGKTNRRIDAQAKVDGTAMFGIDFTLPGMVHAYVIHAPQYGAKPTHVDDAGARKRAGVIDIFAIPGGVAIVADKYWQALAAARDVKITWGEGDTARLSTAELRAAMLNYDERGTSTREDGDAGKALARASTKLRATYEAPYLAHAPLEPQNCTVAVSGRTAEVWGSVQAPTIAQVFVAEAIGGKPEDVLVHSLLCGGSFGRRALGDMCAEAARIAKRVKRPVKLIWSRASDMTQAFYRPIYMIDMEGGLASDGHLTALRAHVISQSIPLSSRELFVASMSGIPQAIKGMFADALVAMFSTSSVNDLFATEGLKDTAYQIENIDIAASPVQTKLPVSTWRSVGHSVTGFAAESFIDELAHAARQDPLAFRKKLVRPGSRQANVLDALGRLSNWDAPRAQGLGRGIARHFSFESEVGEVAEVELVDNRIRVRRVYCVVDCGIAVNPDIVKAQLESAIIFGLSAALDQEITLVDGVVQQRNFDTFPTLRMFEAPEVFVQIIASDQDPTGVGEPGLPPLAAAVANAVFNLTGVRLRRLPLQRAWNERGAK